MKKISKIITSTIAVILLIPFIANAVITTTPAGPEASAYMDTNTVTVDWDNSSYIEMVRPDTEYCYVNETGYNGFNSVTVGRASTITNYTDNGVCSITYDDNTFWEIDGTWTWNMWDNTTRGTLIDTGTFCQGTGCSEGGGTTTATSTYGTTTPEQVTALSIYTMLLLLSGALGFIMSTWIFQHYMLS